MTGHAVARRVAVEILRRQRLVLLVVGGAMIGLWALIVGILLAVDADPSRVWQGFRWVLQYVLLSIGVLVMSMYLPVCVAHGISRRALVVGATRFGLLAVLVSAGAMILVFAVERGLYNAVGLTQFPDGLDPMASFGAGALTFLDITVTYLLYLLAGWFVAAAYYRLGGRLGTAMLVPALALLALAEAWQQRAAVFYDIAPLLGDHAWAGSLFLTMLGALVWWATVGMTASVPVRIK